MPNKFPVSRPPANPRVPVVVETDEPSRTKQAMRDETDINLIVAKYQRTGAMDHFAKHSPQYGDVPAITFHEAMNQVRQAEEMFQDLPSSLRDRFNHDPGAFLDFVQNPENADEMVELGLAERPQPTTPAPPPIVDPEPSGDGGPGA